MTEPAPHRWTYNQCLATLADFNDFLVDHGVAPFVLRESGVLELTIALRHMPDPVVLFQLQEQLERFKPVTLYVKMRAGWCAYWWNRFMERVR